MFLYKVYKVFADERASQFLEAALWIALFTLVVASAAHALGGEVSNKFDQIRDRVSKLGTP